MSRCFLVESFMLRFCWGFSWQETLICIWFIFHDPFWWGSTWCQKSSFSNVRHKQGSVGHLMPEKVTSSSNSQFFSFLCLQNWRHDVEYPHPQVSWPCLQDLTRLKRALDLSVVSPEVHAMTCWIFWSTLGVCFKIDTGVSLASCFAMRIRKSPTF